VTILTSVDRNRGPSLHSPRPCGSPQVRVRLPESRRCGGLPMLGEGEGIEVIGVFFTILLGLGIMVLLGKWWEA